MTTDTTTGPADWADDVERPDTIPVAAAELMAQLVAVNVDQLATTTDRIIDGLTRRAETAEATLAAVHDRVGHLLDGDYQPTARALLEALYPADYVIDTYRKLETS